MAGGEMSVCKNADKKRKKKNETNSPMALGPEAVLAALGVDDRPVVVGQAGRELDF
jgi:hypothetical protein